MNFDTFNFRNFDEFCSKLSNERHEAVSCDTCTNQRRERITRIGISDSVKPSINFKNKNFPKVLE